VDTTEEAIGYITSCCPRVGSFSGSVAANHYLAGVAEAIRESSPTDLFPDRYKEHVSHALMMVAGSMFTDPPAAIASVYLATRFEFYFRVLSGKLTASGSWLSAEVHKAAQEQIPDARVRRRRISSVALAYKVMKLDRTRPVARVFDHLDRTIFPEPMRVAGGGTIADVGERIEYGRHASGHGELGDISAEGIFYGLVTAIVFHNQT